MSISIYRRAEVTKLIPLTTSLKYYFWNELFEPQKKASNKYELAFGWKSENAFN